MVTVLFERKLWTYVFYWLFCCVQSNVQYLNRTKLSTEPFAVSDYSQKLTSFPRAIIRTEPFPGISTASTCTQNYLQVPTVPKTFDSLRAICSPQLLLSFNLLLWIEAFHWPYCILQNTCLILLYQGRMIWNSPRMQGSYISMCFLLQIWHGHTIRGE